MIYSTNILTSRINGRIWRCNLAAYRPSQNEVETLEFMSKTFEMKPKFRAVSAFLIVATSYLPVALQAQDEYSAKLWRGAEEVLSGEWAKQLPPPLSMPYEFNGPKPERVFKVPAPGVHQRVLTSPDEIDAIRRELASENPDPFLVVNFERLKAHAAQKSTVEGDPSHWGRVSVLGARALMALITEDGELRKQVASDVVDRAKHLELLADEMNADPLTRDNAYYIRAKSAPNLFPLQKTSIAMEYDYAAPYMSEEQRVLVRRAISKLSSNRYLSFMEMPGQFSMNNHISLGQNFLLLSLAIEGEEGFDARVSALGMKKFEEHLAWTLSPEGVGYEQTKGFINGYLFFAYARRNPDLFRMDRIWAYVNYMARQSVFIGDLEGGAKGEGKVAPDASAIGAASTGTGWDLLDKESPNLMKAIHSAFPSHPVVDFAYKSFFPIEAQKKYRGHPMHDIDLLTMRAGLRREDGAPRTYELDGPPEAVQALGLSWVDPMRGFATVRSGWGRGALLAQYEARNDFYYSGHETPDYGDFNLFSHGGEWIVKQQGYSEPFYHNMTSVNGVGPKTLGAATARFDSFSESGAAVTLVSDHANGWRWSMIPGGHDLSHPMYTAVDTFLFNRQSVFMHDRNTTVPVPPRIRRFYEGYAHTDYGPWHGENRGPYMYQRWQDIDGYFRIFHVARGTHPYILLLDDFNKDGRIHQYNMGLQIAKEARLVSVDDKAWTTSKMEKIGDPVTVPADLVGTDFLFARDNEAQGMAPKAGTPMLLVRVLWRNTNYPYPLPSFTKIEVGQAGSFSNAIGGRISIPARAVDPEYRVLLYPFLEGDPLPDTTWNDDRSALTVQIGEQEDRYVFERTTAGRESDSPGAERTVFVQEREGKTVAVGSALPPTPRLAAITQDGLDLTWDELGWPNDLSVGGGETRFAKECELRFVAPRDGLRIEYRLPGGDWKTYLGPVRIADSTRVQARTVARVWPFAKAKESEIFAWTFTKVAPRMAPAEVPTEIRCRVYEYRRTIYDERGFYTGKKTLMADLEKLEPIFDGAVKSLSTPSVQAKLPMSSMAKATYLYEMPFAVAKDGLFRFKLNAPGPLFLEVDGLRIIENLGPHRMDQHDHFGDIPLAAGVHSIRLAVTDPVFWKGAAAEPMRFSLGVIGPDTPEPQRYVPLYLEDSRVVDATAPEGILSAVQIEPAKGWVREIYDAIGRNPFSDEQIPPDGVPAAYFEMDKKRRVDAARASDLEENLTYHAMERYLGYYYAAIEGVYRFRLDGGGSNQIWLHGKLLDQNGVEGGASAGKAVRLERGWHPVDLRFGRSGRRFEVLTPLDQEWQSVALTSIGSDPGFDPGSAAKSLERSLVARGPGEHHGLALVRNAFTVAAWVKLNPDPKIGKQPFDLYATPGKTAGASIRGGNILRTGHWHMGAQLNSVLPLSSDAWTHVAVCYDQKRIWLYVNGKLTNSALLDRANRNQRIFDIDLPGEIPQARFHAQRIYNLHPTPEQLAAIMQADKPE